MTTRKMLTALGAMLISLPAAAQMPPPEAVHPISDHPYL